MKQMTFEEAKQKIAEKYNVSPIESVIISACFIEDIEGEINILFTEAAELWQQYNLERIKELECEEKTHLSKISFQDKIIEVYEKIVTEKSDRVEELEDGLRFFTLLNESYYRDISGGINKAKELLK